jgi:Domain of unknown function (DUF4396)
MLPGVMLLWFVLTAASVAFVAIDIRNTPESPVLKWGFVLLTLYTGPIGAFLYVLGCREPLPGLHERYVAATWRQVLGSTMHCVAGDGVGIVAGAVIGGLLLLARPAEMALEYVLGFAFGWTIFQALFMRDMAGGSFLRSLQKTFTSELLSMNFLMAGMLPVAAAWRVAVPAASDALRPEFWFAMSMALLAGFVIAYPMNWWLVTRGLKHGMMTVRMEVPAPATHQPMHAMTRGGDGDQTEAHAMHKMPAAAPRILPAAIVSFSALVIGVAAAAAFYSAGGRSLPRKIGANSATSAFHQPPTATIPSYLAAIRFIDWNEGAPAPADGLVTRFRFNGEVSSAWLHWRGRSLIGLCSGSAAMRRKICAGSGGCGTEYDFSGSLR